jgi:hypothetical protein
LAAIKSSRLAQRDEEERAQLDEGRAAAEEEELRRWLESLQAQHAILVQRKHELAITSPIRGEMITWNAPELLTSRPVSRGQHLLTVADLDGPWILELRLPDHRAGHLLDAQKARGRDLAVSFILATDPNTRYRGRIDDVARTTELDESETPSLIVRVRFAENQIGLLRPGATVIAKIHCGRRSLGFVWFHELIEFVQSRVLFRW